MPDYFFFCLQYIPIILLPQNVEKIICKVKDFCMIYVSTSYP